MLEQLRKLGLVVEISDGKLELRVPYVAAKAGVPLTPEQARVLMHFERPIIIFSITLVSCWSEGEVFDF